MIFEKKGSTFFENTKTENCYDSDGHLAAYRITPNEGFVLHTVYHDKPVFDDETGEATEELIKGYTKSHIVLDCDYEFDVNPFEIYAVDINLTLNNKREGEM